MSAAEGQAIARLSLTVLSSLRIPEKFKLFFDKVVIYQKKFNVQDPALPRKYRSPSRFEVGSSSGHFHTTVEDHYRAVYYEVLDLVVEGIKDRFNQRGYSVFQHLEELLLKTCKGESTAAELDYVCTFYGNDIDRQQLDSQLPMLHELVKQAWNHQIVTEK